jgi:outer membrane receptor protein involved in Fe transport
MSHKSQISIRPIAAAVAAALATPTAALAQEEGSSSAASELEEVLVTATKIVQDVQKIPSTVQAIPESMLKEMGALNTEDYVRFMPAVSFINISNTDSAVIFRGVSTGYGGFIGTQPASVYYDEVSVSGTRQQPNIRMLDINRVEALVGPQGTLFGASAQSGTLRIITNKPDPSKFEANVDTELRGG